MVESSNYTPRETEQSSGETPCAVNVSSSLRNSLLTSMAPEQRGMSKKKQRKETQQQNEVTQARDEEEGECWY